MVITKTGMTEEQRAAIEVASSRCGLSISAFVRMAALDRAASMGCHPQQPVLEGQEDMFGDMDG